MPKHLYARMSKTEDSTLALVNLKAPPVYKIIVAQFIATLLAALGAFVLKGGVTGYSVFFGRDGKRAAKCLFCH